MSSRHAHHFIEHQPDITQHTNLFRCACGAERRIAWQEPSHPLSRAARQRRKKQTPPIIMPRTFVMQGAPRGFSLPRGADGHYRRWNDEWYATEDDA